jgi:hypothetical protein
MCLSRNITQYKVWCAKERASAHYFIGSRARRAHSDFLIIKHTNIHKKGKINLYAHTQIYVFIFRVECARESTLGKALLKKNAPRALALFAFSLYSLSKFLCFLIADEH